MEFTFILVEPTVPGNVGASARALKTMGFNRLMVVNSDVHLLPEARWLAHGSADILDGIVKYDMLSEAVSGMDMVIGTTAKKRRVHSDHYLCSEIPGLISGKSGMLNNVAIVFGREESGLTNEELKLCNIFSRIPMHGKYPSLNLSQSVMLYAWELARFNIISSGPVETPLTKAPAMGKYKRLRTVVEGLLRRLGFDDKSAFYCRVMERLEVVGDKDAGLLLSVCSRVEEIFTGIDRFENHKGD